MFSFALFIVSKSMSIEMQKKNKVRDDVMFREKHLGMLRQDESTCKRKWLLYPMIYLSSCLLFPKF